MPYARASAALLVSLGLALGGALLPACGSSDASNKDYGAPPDPAFDPGLGGNDPYGYGNQELPFECPAELKRCEHTFTYPFRGQGSVELRGDYGGPATWERGTPMTREGDVWMATVAVPYGAPVEFKFFVDGKDWEFDPDQPTVGEGVNTNNTFAGTTCEPAICEEQCQLPAGVFDWRESVIYFVFVDRFRDGKPSNNCTVPGVTGGASSIANYRGGDWAGVKAKIDDGYFTSLGINTLWLTVPFDNPNVAGKGVGTDTNVYSGYHGYWPKIDSDDPSQLAHESCFGTFQELKDVVAAAHAKGIKVLIDYAMVHVHASSSIWSGTGPGVHKDWFWPNDNGNGGNCVCGQGCSWDNLPDRERCWFTDYLPHWRYDVPAALEYSVANAVEWVKQTRDASGMGIDGFRADAIKHVDVRWLTALRARLKTQVTAQQSPPQRFYMVGETYDFGNREVIRSYVDPVSKLDGQFDFPLRKHIVEATLMRTAKMSDLAAFMNGNDYFYGADAVMSTFVGNHDLPRVIHLAANDRLWGDDQGADGKDRAWSNLPGPVTEREAFERLANGFAVIFTNRGAPLVYYGDEIGLPGGGDPDNRRMMPWTTPTANQRFLRDRIAKLAEIRRQHPALRSGARSTIHADADTWLYVRSACGDTVYVAINRSDVPKEVRGLPGGPLAELVTGEGAAGPNATIPPRQTRIFVRP